MEKKKFWYDVIILEHISMALWDDTPSTLTSFGPPSSETQSSGNFLRRLFKRGKDDSDVSSEGSKPSSREVSVDRYPSREQSTERNHQDLSSENSSPRHTASKELKLKHKSKSEAVLLNREESDNESSVTNTGTSSTATTSPTDENKPYTGDVTKRTLGSVLTRLSAILERRAPTPQVYRDSDFKQYWMPDSSCKECYDCGDKFTTFRRRHHCRICGQIFCNACCSQELSGKIIGYKGSIRLCTYCFQIVNRYTQRTDPSADPKVIKEALHKCMQSDRESLSPDKTNKRPSADGKGSLSLRPTDESDPNDESTAPFDLTPQTDFVVSEKFSTERKMLSKDSSQLRNLWNMMNDPSAGVEYQTYRIRLRTFQNCVAGNRIVDWLMKQDKVSNRVQAIAIGQALIDAAFLDPIHTITTPFRDDFTLYRPSEIPTADTLSPEFESLEDSISEDTAPQWFHDIESDSTEFDHINGSHDRDGDCSSSHGYSDLSEDSRGHIRVEERHFDEPLPRQNLMGGEDVNIDPIFDGNSDAEKSMNTEEVTKSWRTLNFSSDDSQEQETFDKLQKEYHEHLTALTKQLLHEENVSSSWTDIIISTVDRISLFVKPDVKNNSDDMDIRRYVHINKIPGGNREQTSIVHGVIFTKNIAHKKMLHQINNPSVLLLHGCIEYQRVENKMSYLEPQILQEEEFLRKNIKKITSLKPKPDILVVEKSVSRLAQDFLLKAGITLIYNVKPTVMSRLSRFLVTDIVSSVESLVRGVKLGFCHTFSVKSFVMPCGTSKSMLFFDGCANHLGCAVTLRGGSVSELKRVKKIMQFLIYASYHARLEMAFCMDEFLKPPIKEDIDFDLEEIKPVKKPKDSISTQSGEKNSKDLLEPKDIFKEPKESKESIKTQSCERNSNELVEPKFNQNVDTTAISDSYISSDSSVKRVDEYRSTDLSRSSVDNVDEKSAKEKKVSGENSSDTSCQFYISEVAEATDNAVKEEASIAESSERMCSFINVTTNGSVNSRFNDTTSQENQSNDHCETKNENQSDKNISTSQNAANSNSINSSNGSVSCVDLRKRNPSGNKHEKSPSVLRRSATTQLTDNSDPLSNYQISKDESIFQSSSAITLQEQLVTHRTKFKKALDNTLLSTSPYINYHLPYLETEIGSKCELRKYCPEEIYWSGHFSTKIGHRKNRSKDIDMTRKSEPASNVLITEAHEFIRCHLDEPATHLTTQCMLAKFRAYGGRINVTDSLTPDPSAKVNDKNQSNKSKRLVLDVTRGDNGTVFDKKDCLDPFQHQRIAVLFSSFSYESENHPSPCVYPWVVKMEFYGRNDTTLGGFLERFCFRPSYVCPSDSCNTSMEKHMRRFVHGDGCISLVLKRLDQPIPNGQNGILMWSWCHRCKQVTPVVPMSRDAWNMSFSRYLEFRFHGNSFQRRVGAEPACLHSLHHDHFQYFGYKDTVASFKYSTIKVKEIKVPPIVIEHKHIIETIQLFRLKDEVKKLTLKITDIFSIVLDYMTKMKAESLSDNLTKFISDCMFIQQNEKADIRNNAHSVKEKIETLLKQEEKKFSLNKEQLVIYGEIEDGIVRLKRSIAESVINWNIKLQEVNVQHKKSKQGTNTKKDKEREPTVSSSGGHTIDVDAKSTPPSYRSVEDVPSINTLPFDDSLSFSPSDDRKSEFSVVSYPPPILLSPPPASLENSIEKMMECSSSFVSIETSINSTADTLEESAGFEPHVVTSTREVTHPNTSTQKTSNYDTASSVKKVLSEESSDVATGDKIGMFKERIINTIWQGPGAFQIQPPFEPCDHHMLSMTDKCIPIIVYDHEQSSIIAYSLSCQDYLTKLNEIQKALRNVQSEMEASCKTTTDEHLAKRPSSSKLSFFKGGGKEIIQQDSPDTVRYFNKTDGSVLESPQDDTEYSSITTSTSKVSDTSTDKSKINKVAINHHIELQFSDSLGRFYCKVYFAEQFRQLRKQIYPEGEDYFIRSLSRCKPWEAKGGKSGSSFCKTNDDRFILKQMSPMEVESFERFGPEYFQYISSVEKQQRPTALTKIVGVYRIGFRNQFTNNAMKQDLLVMENLFYNRCISQTFDLKGSERNRLVKQRKRDEETVLLDENFLRASVDCPLYILSHSKMMLMLAIGHDSQFLSSNLVMDYSLLVGIDEQNRELVVGIIDYIRTFTWDKKLETILKSNFGGQGKMPTVVSPEVYRTRFLDAMRKYFLPVPDQWTGLGHDVDPFMLNY
ncbi:hypothetical protein ACF0H5_022855 [Mactra antiquata]